MNIVRGLSLALLVLVVILAPWCFGSVQTWAQLVCLVVVLLASAFSFALPSWRTSPLNGVLLLTMVMVAVSQLIGLPASWQQTLAPAATSIRGFFGATPDHVMPSSVDPASTRIAIATLISAVVVCLVSSRCVSSWMLRGILLAIAINGACLATMGIWQQQFQNDLIYGVIKTASSPFGPFVNRNNAAGFLLSSLAAAGGLLLLSLNTTVGANRGQMQYSLPLSAKFVSGWSQVSFVLCIVIVLGILFSQSRGGVFALLLGAICTAILVVQRRHIGGAVVVAFVGVAAVAILALCADMWLPISMRFSATFDETQLAGDGRITIWQSCIGLIQDFWLTGSGLGTFGKVFRLYDNSPDGFIATHAENVFLQLACEGGLVMLVLALTVVGVYFRKALYMVQQRHPVSFCLGIMTIFLLASQCVASCFDFGLYIPANLYQLSLLLGVFAGLAARVSSPERDQPSNAVERLKSNRVSKKVRVSFVQGAIDRKFEIILMGLICLGCFTIPDLIRASALETLPPGLQQERIGSTEGSKSEEPDTEHERLERNLSFRFDDSDAHYAIAESLIRRFESALNKDQALNSETPLKLSDFSQRLRVIAEAQPSEAQRVLASPMINEYLVPALNHLKYSRDACCLNPNVHLRLFHLSILRGDNGEKDLERMVRLVEGARFRMFAEGLAHFESGDYQKAFVSWKPCLETKSAYRSQIIRLATQVATVDELLEKLFPKTDWFLLELANKHLLNPEQRELRERVLELAKLNAG